LLRVKLREKTGKEAVAFLGEGKDRREEVWGERSTREGWKAKFSRIGNKKGKRREWGGPAFRKEGGKFSVGMYDWEGRGAGVSQRK